MSEAFELAVVRSLRLRETLDTGAEPQGHKPGCKGAACPAFAICQGRCAAKRQARAVETAGPMHI